METKRFGRNQPKFTEIFVEESKVYFAVIMYIYLVQKPTLQSWSTDKNIETSYIRIEMKPFKSVSRNLHFANNEIF